MRIEMEATIWVLGGNPASCTVVSSGPVTTRDFSRMTGCSTGLTLSGWRDAQGSVWKYDGEWLGRVVEQNYWRATCGRCLSGDRPRCPFGTGSAADATAPRVARAVRPNCCDPLEAFAANANIGGIDWRVVFRR